MIFTAKCVVQNMFFKYVIFHIFEYIMYL